MEILKFGLRFQISSDFLPCDPVIIIQLDDILGWLESSNQVRKPWGLPPKVDDTYLIFCC